METKNSIVTPMRAVHPGEILREELRERGIKQKDFAKQIGVQASHLSEFIRGKRNLNEGLAIKFEVCLGIPFKVWMELHNGYVYDCKMVERRCAEKQMLSVHKEIIPCFMKMDAPILDVESYKLAYHGRSRIYRTKMTFARCH